MNAIENDDIKPFLLKSALLHILVILFFTIKYLIGPSESITYIPSIKVDIVALPDKQTPKPAPPPTPEPKPAPPKPEVTTPPKPTVKPKAVTPKPSKPVVKPDNSEEIRNSAIERMKALERIKSEVKEEDTPVKGNRISPGTEMSGLNRIDYDAYIGSLQSHAKANWSIPRWLSGSDLTAEIRVFLDERGYVIRRELIRSSGDQSFDDSVVAAITNASPFPPPKDKFVDVVRINGIIFTLRP